MHMGNVQVVYQVTQFISSKKNGEINGALFWRHFRVSVRAQI